MKKIPLINKKGETVNHAIVDNDDYGFLTKMRWFASPDKSGGLAVARRYYARSKTDGKILIMHRVIMKAIRGQMVDHINGDGLDNRKSNLRFVTPTGNQLNRRDNHNNSSGMRGVSKDVNGGWRATKRINGRQKYLGTYDTVEEAHQAYLKEHKKVCKQHGL